MAIRRIFYSALFAVLVAFSPFSSAGLFDFSYLAEPGRIYEGRLSGILLPDGDTVQVTTIESLSLNGASLAATPFLDSVQQLYDESHFPVN